MLQQKAEFSSARPLEPDQAYMFFFGSRPASHGRSSHERGRCRRPAAVSGGMRPPTVPRAEYIRGCDN